jgi:hypothetical protein
MENTEIEKVIYITYLSIPFSQQTEQIDDISILFAIHGQLA